MSKKEVKCRAVFSRKDAFNAVKAASRLTASKTTLPILKSVLFRTCKDKNLVTVSTDLTVIQKNIFPAALLEAPLDNFSFCVDSRLLKGILSSADEEVEITVDDKSAYVRSGDAFRARMALLDAKDFPATSRVDGDFSGGVEVTMSELKRALEKILTVTFAGRTFGDRFLVEKDANSDGIVFIGTDGTRLGVIRAKEINNGSTASFSVVVPLRVAGLILEASLPDDAVVVIGGDKTGFFVKSETWVCATTLYDEPYADYKRVLSNDFRRKERTKICLQKKSLMSAVERVVRLKLSDTGRVVCRKDKLTLVTRDWNNDSEVEIEVPLDEDSNVTLDGMTLGVNWGYLLGILSSIDAEKIRWLFLDDRNPFEFVGDATNDIYMLAPVLIE